MLSHTKNIFLDPSNVIHLVYFSSSGNTWIRIAYNDDSTIAGNWKTMEIYNGQADGYVETRDPSISLDADGDRHCAFIARDNIPTEYILYSRSSDGLSWSKPDVAFTVPGDGILDDPTVDAVEVNGDEIVVITYQDGTTIFLAYSWDEGMTWQKPAPLSTGDDMLPDTCATPDGYVHTVWEHDEGDDKRVEYIRAHFEAE
jgi:hypothetical protein